MGLSQIVEPMYANLTAVFGWGLPEISSLLLGDCHVLGEKGSTFLGILDPGRYTVRRVLLPPGDRIAWAMKSLQTCERSGV